MAEHSGNTARTMLLGLGNPILCDDAIGIRLVRNIKQRIAAPADLDIIEDCSLGGLNLLQVIEGYAKLIVVDAIQTSTPSPGRWHYFTAERLQETLHLGNIHDINFATALELGRRLGMSLPVDANIHIFAVEILDNRTFSETMSGPLETCFPELAEQIYGCIRPKLHFPNHPCPQFPR